MAGDLGGEAGRPKWAVADASLCIIYVSLLSPSSLSARPLLLPDSRSPIHWRQIARSH